MFSETMKALYEQQADMSHLLRLLSVSQATGFIGMFNAGGQQDNGMV
jgi:hypothetical protein